MAYSSDLCIDGLATASSYDVNQPPAWAFDDNVGKGWMAANILYSQWIQYNFPGTRRVGKIRFQAGFDTVQQPNFSLVKNFEFYGVNGDGSLTLLHAGQNPNVDGWYETVIDNTAAYTAYRFTILDNWHASGGEFHTGLRELEMFEDLSLAPVYSGDLCTGGTATASSQHPSLPAGGAFDDVFGAGQMFANYWRANDTASPQWIEYQFAAPEAVSRLRLWPQYDAYTQTVLVKDFEVAGSNDGVNFTPVYTAATINSDTWHDFEFANAQAYAYWRVSIFSHHYTPFSSFFVGIKEMELMARTGIRRRVRGGYRVLAASVKPVRGGYGVGYKQPAVRNVAGHYNVPSIAVKGVRAEYDLYGSFRRRARGGYHVFGAVRRQVNGRYHLCPPALSLTDVDENPLTGVFPGVLLKGRLSDEFTILIWNDRDGSADALGAASVFLSLEAGAGSGAENGAEAATEKWLELKSNGVTGAGIMDDAQTSFTPVGGDPSTGGLSLGAIPSGAARHITGRLNIPSDAAIPFSAYPELSVQYTAALLSGYGFNYGFNYGGA